MAAPDQAPANRDFTDYVCELLAPLGHASARRMFGGYGVYVGDTMIAIVFDGALYLKVDDETRAAFEAAGARPFVYRDATQEIAMSYWSTPEDALDSGDAMAPWARLALAAARRKAAAKKAPKGGPRKGTAKRPGKRAAVKR